MDPAVLIFLLVSALGLGMGMLDARFKFEKRLRGSGRRLLRRPNYARIAELERELGIGQGAALDVPTPREATQNAPAMARVSKGPPIPIERALRGLDARMRADLLRYATWERNATGREVLAYRYAEGNKTVVELRYADEQGHAGELVDWNL